GVLPAAGRRGNQSRGQVGVEAYLGVIADEVEQSVQLPERAGQDTERSAEHGRGLARAQDSGKSMSRSEVLEMADVELLVEVGCEAFEDDRLCGGRLRQRQLEVGSGEVIVVEAVGEGVGVTGRQVSEDTPWSRNPHPRTMVAVCTEVSWVGPFWSSKGTIGFTCLFR